MTPRREAASIREELIRDDTCPECLGELDAGRECVDCDYDAMAELPFDDDGEGD